MAGRQGIEIAMTDGVRYDARPEASGDENREKRAYRGERREEQKQATQARVLESALALFAEKGFDATSVRDIAAQAGVTHAVIRLHFGSKAQLWNCAVDYLFGRMAREMRPRPGEPAFEDGRAGIECFMRRYVHYCARHPEHARLMLQESMHDNEQLAYAVENHIAPSHAFMERLLRGAIDDGILPRMETIHLTYILAAAGQSVFALAEEARRVYGVDVLADEFVERHVDAVVGLFLRS